MIENGVVGGDSMIGEGRERASWNGLGSAFRNIFYLFVINRSDFLYNHKFNGFSSIISRLQGLLED